MAPEILRHERYDGRADIWSVGSIIYELVCGCTPFTGGNPLQLLANIERSDKLKFPGSLKISDDLKELLSSVLVKNPNDRISCSRFFAHPYNIGSTDYPEVFEKIDIASVSADEEEFTVCEVGEAEEAPREISLVIRERSLVDVSANIVQESRTEIEQPAASVPPVIREPNLSQYPPETNGLQFLDSPPLEGTYTGAVCALAHILRTIAEEISDTCLLIKALELLDKAIDESADPSVRKILRDEWDVCVMLGHKFGASEKKTGNLFSPIWSKVGELVKDAAADLLLGGGESAAYKFSANSRFRVSVLLLDFLLSEGDAEQGVDTELWDNDRNVISDIRAMIVEYQKSIQ